MNVFQSNLQTYGEKWKVTKTDVITAEDVKALRSYDVVDTEYGRCVLLMYVTGGQSYAKISEQGHMPQVGEKIDLVGKKFLTLSRTGEKDCYKIEL